MKLKLFLAIMVVILALGCQDEQIVKEKPVSEIIIKTGTICGWCSLDDTLSIDGNSVRYVNYTQCNNARPAIEKKGAIEISERDSILALLDFHAFKQIELNTCNVCFDGCDRWIFVKKGSETHTIRFTGNESELGTIKSFMDALDEIKASYD